MDHVLVVWTAVELLQSMEAYALTFLVKTEKFRQRKASIPVVLTGKKETFLVNLADPRMITINLQNNSSSLSHIHNCCVYSLGRKASCHMFFVEAGYNL